MRHLYELVWNFLCKGQFPRGLILVTDSKVNYLSAMCSSLSDPRLEAKRKQNQKGFSIIFVSKAYITRISFKHKCIHSPHLRFTEIHGKAEFLPCENYGFLFMLKLAFYSLLFASLWQLPYCCEHCRICHHSWHALSEAVRTSGLRLYPNADSTIRRILHSNKTLKNHLGQHEEWLQGCVSLSPLWHAAGSKTSSLGDSVVPALVKD